MSARLKFMFYLFPDIYPTKLKLTSVLLLLDPNASRRSPRVYQDHAMVMIGLALYVNTYLFFNFCQLQHCKLLACTYLSAVPQTQKKTNILCEKNRSRLRITYIYGHAWILPKIQQCKAKKAPYLLCERKACHLYLYLFMAHLRIIIRCYPIRVDDVVKDGSS